MPGFMSTGERERKKKLGRGWRREREREMISLVYILLQFSAGYQPTVGVDYGFKIQTVKNTDCKLLTLKISISFCV